MKSRQFELQLVWLASMAMFLAAPSSGAIVHTVTIQGASSTEGGSASQRADRQPLWTLGGSGFTSIATPVEASGHSNSRQGNTWISSVSANDAFITYDLGSVRSDITKMFLWNANVPGGGTETDRGIQQYDVWTSDSDTLSAATPGGTPTLSDLMLPQNSGANGSAQVTMVNLSGVGPFRYLRIDVDSNHGGSLTGLAEVMFQDSRVDLTDLPGGSITSNYPGIGSETTASLIDDSIRSRWTDSVVASPSNPVQIDYIFASERGLVTSYVLSSAIVSRTDLNSGLEPSDWTLQGSNDGGGSWTIVDTVIDFAFPDDSFGPDSATSRLQGIEFDVDNPGAYGMYRLSITEIANVSSESVRSIQLGDIQIYGSVVPEPSSVALSGLLMLGGSGIVLCRRLAA